MQAARYAGLMTSSHASLPEVLAGPILRRALPDRLVIWLVGARPLDLTLTLHVDDAESPSQRFALDSSLCRRVPVGEHAWLHLIDVPLTAPLPYDRPIGYDLRVAEETSDATQGIADWASHLLYDDADRPCFVLRSRFDSLLHGSCRKPHHPSEDGLVRADAHVAASRSNVERMPAALLMTGDQIYADDVAGPMLVAIHALIQRLGLFGECVQGAVVEDADSLYTHPDTYYRREHLLPAFEANEKLRERFFGGVRKPVFTTSSAHNHLITLAEIMAMYLLTWSPTPWSLIEMTRPSLDDTLAETFDAEAGIIAAFREGLPRAARVMAHIPTLMIFDDHDVTDDWNLSAAWEETAYGHPFSRRIIGNALLGYLLCQGWGNDPDAFRSLWPKLGALFEHRDAKGRLDCQTQDALIEQLYDFDHWHYQLPSTPRLVVLDTRTHRWRSERRRHHPSGLMDWEALSELQQTLLGQHSVIVVSPAPMFGVKLIEGIQRLFTLVGKPLLVDAENWMAHRGAASVMLNIFRHTRTPGNYVILSGDVHYSFVYDIEVRHRQRGPRLWQITSSGLKNEFPTRLLDVFDRLNRWLYAPASPLNWFTKRRPMHILPRYPQGASHGERLWNQAGIGLVTLDAQGRPASIAQLGVDGSTTYFLQDD
ncbi:alkaline phosphatase family protein [Chromohalobacter sp. TMW 2.2308]|uniref:Alkaline phosphatase family protein n=1 Tax=Chromohalobacter moromii TaxID=2860329 RepID=A0A9X2X183_9GAMM|nr:MULTISPECIES: alkaline phosphatase D family protein [Chromohalobacter]MCK2042812.1 alkaline phosphatase family protein [Chromohalobacter moromii]MCK2045296.1 alkaline phosphatase family protein [Chromohalobacter moromii]MCT8505037.1 alkaline phosphatase family protein [Chromohalobacter moromii]MCT8514668.1 alkaline phosphatase family protein [Chromohalobacter sp. TMW 2.2271]